MAANPKLRNDAVDDGSLFRRASARDPQAIALIIQRHNQRLYRIARSILRDDREAEDALQEAYFRAFSQLGTFRGEARLGTWLARIVINEALGRRRRVRPTAELTESPPTEAGQIIPFPSASFQLDPEASAAQRQVQALLERAIDTLPDGFRTILVARAIEGMSIEETAALFDIPPDTVKTRLHRARQLLRRELEKHIGPVLGSAFPFGGSRCSRLAEGVLKRLGLG